MLPRSSFLMLLMGFLAVCAVQAQEPAGLAADLKPERTKLLAGSKVKLGVMLRLQAPEAPEGAEPACVAIALVLDRSGSMDGANKLTMVHEASVELVDRLQSSDELGIVTYETGVEVLRPLAGLNDVDGIKQLIRQVATAGGTNLGGGLSEGIGLFKPQAQAGAVKRLLLLTDGIANQGETDPEVLAEWAKKAFVGGTRISTVGLGADYNEHLLTKLAHAGGGEFYYVTSKDQLPELFKRELQEGRQVAVRDLTATVRTQDGAKCLEIVGYPFTGGTEAAREAKVGDFFAKESRSLLVFFEFAVPNGLEGAAWQPAEVALAWHDAAGKDCARTLSLPFDLSFLESAVAASADPAVRGEVLQIQNFRGLDQAMSLYRNGKREDAIKAIENLEKALSGDPAAAQNPALLEQAGQFAQARREIEQDQDARSTSIYNTAAGNYGQRRGGSQRKAVVMRGGGGKATESAVDLQGNWLEKIQSKNGSWDPAACGGREEDRLESTALALLSFLGAGHTEKVGRFKPTVENAVHWLVAQQQDDGRLVKVPPETDALAHFRALQQQALGTLALAEAAGMGRVPETVAAAQKAIDALLAAKPFEAAERCLAGAGAVEARDIAGIGWCMLAVKSSKVSGLHLPQDSFEPLGKLIEKHTVASEGPKGRMAFRGGEPQLLDTMVGVLCRLYMNGGSHDERAAVAWVMAQPGGVPAWEGEGERFDWYLSYFGNLAAFQVGGEEWTNWNAGLKGVLVGRMTKEPPEKRGTIPAAGNMKERGDLFTTAIGTLCLEVYYRYLPVYR